MDNNFIKYNSKIKNFLKRINIKGNRILDENDNELVPYNKIVKSLEEKEELLFFQNNVISNIVINKNKFGEIAIDAVKAIAGGSYSLILYTNGALDNKLIIKIQEHEKLSDVEAYLKITNNLTKPISPYLIKMYGVFKSFNKLESFDENIYYEPNIKYTKKLLNVYIIFENADGNIRELTKYLSNLKINTYDKWISILKHFIFSIINVIKFLHYETDEKYALLHLDLRPENIVYIKNNNNFEFKLIDIGSVVEYKFDNVTSQERLRGSGIYSKYVYKNTPYRDYYNLWLTICEVFDLYDFKSYKFTNSREKIRELVANCHKQTEILSNDKPQFLNDLFGLPDNDPLINNLQNLKNSVNIFRQTEKLKFNISREDLLNYTNKFIL
jgi:hypothetical protein